MNRLRKVVFVLILLLAGFIRLYKIDKIPPSLNWDEISHGYNAYSLLKTGKDQWGVKWPVFNFRAYGDYPTTLNMYLTIPSVFFFGLNEISVRLPAALCGIGIVILSYFLGRILLKREIEGLLLMFLAAISPWLILPSRAVFQSTIAQFFLVAGIVFFLQFVKRKKMLLLFLSSVFLSFSQYGYHNTRIIAPLIVLAAVVIYKKEIFRSFQQNKIKTLLPLLIFVFLTVLQLLNLFKPEAKARGVWTFLIDQGAINIINEQRRTFEGSELAGKLYYNKLTYFIPRFVKNFSLYFNPLYLFKEGGSHYQFTVPGWGVLFFGWLPFFYIGLLTIIIKALQKNKDFLFIVFWWLIGLVPAAVTKDGFQAMRSMTIIPLPQLSILMGFITFLKFFKGDRFGRFLKRLSLFCFLIYSLLHLSFYLKDLFSVYSKYYSWAWQYGYKEAVEYMKNHYAEYDRIIFTKKYGEPHEFILFYWPWEPSYYQQDTKKVWDYHANWYWVDAFDKFEFVNDWEVKEKINPPAGGQKSKILLITSPGNYIEGGKLLETINFLDGSKAFEVVNYEL